MAFQSSSHNVAGGVSYEEAFQLLLPKQPSNNEFPPGQVNYPSQPSSTPYQSLEHNYSRIYPQTFLEDALPQLPLETGTGQQKTSDEIVLSLDELKQGITSIQTKCDNLGATVSELQIWMKASIDQMNEYIEYHRAWSLIFKRAVENQIRDRDSIRDRAGGSEDSAIE